MKSKVTTRTYGLSKYLSLENKMDKFCVAMDNYFTLPHIIAALREINVGVVGTARYLSGSWPPKILKDMSKEKATFNEFYYTVDDMKTLVARWMDNGMVFLRFHNAPP